MSLEAYLEELADLEKPIVHSKLLNLSLLDKEESEEFSRNWPDIDVRRRRRISRDLIDLAEDNVEADFEEVFRVCLDDPDEEVRMTAIDGLWECNGRWLMGRLLDLQDGDPSLEVRKAATAALEKFCLMAELGDLRPADAERLQNKLFGLFEQEDEDVSLRRRALEASSPFSTPKVNDLIRQAYHADETDLKIAAIYAIGRHCDTDWLPVLLTELKNSDAVIRYEAARACGELEDDRSVRHLSALLDDEDYQVQQAAIQALGFIGGREAKNILRRCLSSPESEIKEAAEAALEYINTTGDPGDPTHLF